MEDSDDEIFWGPVTTRELKIISRKLFPGETSENKDVVESSDEGVRNSDGENGMKEDNCTSVNSSVSEILHDKGSESNGHNLHIKDNSSPQVSSENPLILITCASSPEENSSKYNSPINTIGVHHSTPEYKSSGDVTFSSNGISEMPTYNEIKKLSSESHEILTNEQDLNFSINGTCDSTEINVSRERTCDLCENASDLGKSGFVSLGNSQAFTNDCSVNTNFSRSVESSNLSSDSHSLQSKIAVVSLNNIESCLEETKNTTCIDSGSVVFDISKLGISCNTDCETMRDACDTSTHDHSCISELTSTGKDQALHDQSTRKENSNSTPLRNLGCTSKIPLLQKSSSGSHKKKVKSDRSSAGGFYGNDGSGCIRVKHSSCVPLSPVEYDVNSDNLVTRSPSGNIIPTSYCLTNTQSATYTFSANYVHVMKSEDISRLTSEGYFDMPSCPVEKETSNSQHGKQSFEDEKNDSPNIDRENGSVLYFSPLDSSSDESENSLNDTLETVETMCIQYMNSTVDGSMNNHYAKVQSNPSPANVLKYESEHETRPRGLERCQYIRSSREDPSSLEIHKGHKDNISAGATAKTPLVRSFPARPASSCPRPLQRLKKTMNFSNIRSPVSAYIKDRPVQLFKNAGKVKPCGRDDIPARPFGQEPIGASAKQTYVNGVSTLPEIKYEKAPGVNVNQSRGTERCGSSKKTYTPTVVRHAGRAVLATVPQNSLKIIKTAEVSVLYDKEVSKTTTL